MKITIITMHNFPNYGSVLQAYATQEKLKGYTNAVEIIDYISSGESVSRRIGSYILAGYKRNHLGHRPNPFAVTIKLPFRILKKIRFGIFIKKYLKLSEKVYCTQEDLKTYPLHNGYYVTGSDQVWKLGYRDKIPFFLNFLPEQAQRIGYAVSFGNYKECKESHNDFASVKDFIHRYSKITVREDVGVDLLNKYCDYSGAIRIMDPTLVLSSDFWRGFATHAKINAGYILVYKVGNESDFEVFARNISTKTGLPLVRVCSNSILHIFKGKGRRIILPPVTEFVALIDNANYVLTDSFHGIAFSLNLGVEPIVFRKEYDGGRITGLLKIFGEEERYCSDPNNVDILESKISWDKVNKILKDERKKTDEFLKSVFGECKDE